MVKGSKIKETEKVNKRKEIDKITKKRQFLFLPMAVVVLAVLAMAVGLLILEHDYLWKAQEMDLFLSSTMFFKQQMVVSGGFLSWIGSFFTQFFYHPWMGVTLLAAWWALLVFVSAKAFRVPIKWLTVLIVPVALLLMSDVMLDYWLYYLKLKGYFFVATIGTTAAVALVWLFRLLPERYFVRSLFVVLATIIGYPLFGFYGLMAVGLMAVLSWRLTDMPMLHRVVTTILAVVCIVGIPMIFYRQVYYQTNIQNIYLTALPLFRITKEYPSYYLPYYLLVAFYLLLAVFYNRGDVKAAIAKTWKWAALQVVLLLATGWMVCHFWYRDQNFHKELAMQYCMEQNDWEGLLAEAADLKEDPTRAMLMMKNLALFRLGRLGDEMFYYRNVSKKSATDIPVIMMQVVGKTMYYQYGLLNFCFRWCMEDGVEYGWRAEYLKLMTKCSLLNGEWQLARKYINLLKQTKFHKEWALQQEKFVGNTKLIAKEKEYEPITHLMDYKDILNSDNTIAESYLMLHLTDSYSNDPLMQELSLIGALWTKDINNFWPRFFHYASLHKGQHIPLHYQEAAYLYGHLENKVDISGMPFDKGIETTYKSFMERAQQLSSLGEKEMAERMYPEFGHTFFYEYFLNRDQQMY
ncbi:MAG: hypothetical protein IKR05_09190 [Prevotella sp.]|nr:hypothetical protein [Prevotella sp.]